MGWKTEREKLQAMTSRQKLSYIFAYYRWGAVLLVGILLLMIYLGDIAYRSTKTFVLQGFIANDEQQLFDEKLLSSEFSAYLKLGPKEIVVFDDSLYVQMGKADHYIEASMAKIYAYMAAKELDFLIAPEFVVDHYLSALAMRDFTHMIDASHHSLSTVLQPYLTKSISSEGIEGFYKLELGFTRYKGEPPLYMIVPKESPNPQMVLRFLEFAQIQ